MLESFYYTSLLFKITSLCYVLGFISYAIGIMRKGKIYQLIPLFLFALSFIMCTVFIIDRWIEAERPPFKTFYESLVFAIWTISLVSIAIEYKYKIKLIGFLSTASILLIFMYALAKRDAEIIALPPALQTWMFIPHVVSYFLAYGALFVAGLSAILYLLKPGGIESHHALGQQQRIDFSHFTYIITKFGFLFLTAGLLLGAWWGQTAWSNYWGWDPKENWALVSWLIFAAYLHCRNIHDWSKKRLAWVVIIGVAAIIFTYIGMDYLPTAEESLHVYSNN